MNLGALSVTVKQHTETVLPISWKGRDFVKGEMWKNEPPFCLAMNKATSDDIAWHCKHRTGRGVVKFYESGAIRVQDMGVPVSRMEESIEAHCRAPLKTARDSDGGPLLAYPSGKYWDEASGKTGSGKRFYHNVISGADFCSTSFVKNHRSSHPQPHGRSWKLMRIQQS